MNTYIVVLGSWDYFLHYKDTVIVKAGTIDGAKVIALMDKPDHYDIASITEIEFNPRIVYKNKKKVE